MDDREFDEMRTEQRHQEQLAHREHAGKYLVIGCDLCLDDFQVAFDEPSA